jgi:putative DNA methylase
MTHKRKLIEVALPLDAINREAAREKSIRHGHPCTLHMWWARRPLAACRAVLFGSLVDDPSAHPDKFPTVEAQEAERERLFHIIEDLIKWENTSDAATLSAAEAEIVRSCEGNPPAVLDPFCGGGSIPLEAQRLGLEAYASDLNPVAVLITKAALEIPPRFSGRPPLHPNGPASKLSSWTGARGLAEDVRHYGRWMSDEAARRIGHLYPPVSVPDTQGGGRRNVIAWLWARTITCPNPACGFQLPLLNSLAIARRRGHETWLEPLPDRERRIVGFRVRFDSGRPAKGSVGRSGATCLACGTSVPLATVRVEAAAGRLGDQLLCTIAEGHGRRIYVEADDEQLRAADVLRPDNVPETAVPLISGIFNTPIYGLDEHWKLFTNRQLVALTTFCGLVEEARKKVIADGGDEEYGDAIATYLGLGIGRLANRSSSQCFWSVIGQKIDPVFARNALPMVWMYAEANPFSDSSGNFAGQMEYLVDALARMPARRRAMVRQLDAAAVVDWPAVDRPPMVVATDPPYYNNIPYADLSDFFYVWLRRCLGSIYPDLFNTILTPKVEELIAEPSRHNGSRSAAATFFETGLRRAFKNMLSIHDDTFPLAIFYAFKQAEDVADGAGRVSTGWETMLQGLLDAGATITGTWPVRTERSGGLREFGRAALASSIVLVCRKRPLSAPRASRKEFLTALHSELPDALRRLQHGNIAPVDLAQASIGPGMAVFSRYARIVEADGTPMTVRSALGVINDALDDVLTEQQGDFDADSRWALAWFEECGMEPGPFGKAETLSKAKNTAVNGLVRAGILEAKGNRVRLLERHELSGSWDPGTDTRLTVWEVTQRLILALELGGEAKAAELLRRIGGLGETARELAYQLFRICERKKWAPEALAYNSLVVAWPEIARLAVGTPSVVESGLV